MLLIPLYSVQVLGMLAERTWWEDMGVWDAIDAAYSPSSSSTAVRPVAAVCGNPISGTAGSSSNWDAAASPEDSSLLADQLVVAALVRGPCHLRVLPFWSECDHIIPATRGVLDACATCTNWTPSHVHQGWPLAALGPACGGADQSLPESQAHEFGCGSDAAEATAETVLLQLCRCVTKICTLAEPPQAAKEGPLASNEEVGYLASLRRTLPRKFRRQ